jgi:hypothetical protein
MLSNITVMNGKSTSMKASNATTDSSVGDNVAPKAIAIVNETMLKNITNTLVKDSVAIIPHKKIKLDFYLADFPKCGTPTMSLTFKHLNETFVRIVSSFRTHQTIRCIGNSRPF